MRLTDEQRAAIVQRYANGEPVKAIASDYQIDTSSVGKLARRAGIPSRRMSPEARMDLIERYRRGDPVKDIAGHCKISVKHVSNVALKAGLPSRLHPYNRERRRKAHAWRREREARAQ